MLVVQRCALFSNDLILPRSQTDDTLTHAPAELCPSHLSISTTRGPAMRRWMLPTRLPTGSPCTSMTTQVAESLTRCWCIWPVVVVFSYIGPPTTQASIAGCALMGRLHAYR